MINIIGHQVTRYVSQVKSSQVQVNPSKVAHSGGPVYGEAQRRVSEWNLVFGLMVAGSTYLLAFYSLHSSSRFHILQSSLSYTDGVLICIHRLARSLISLTPARDSRRKEKMET